MDPGNFGHCILAKPVFHPIFFPYVKAIVGCTCLRCGALRFPSKEDRDEAIKKYIKTGKRKTNQARYSKLTT